MGCARSGIPAHTPPPPTPDWIEDQKSGVNSGLHSTFTTCGLLHHQIHVNRPAWVILRIPFFPNLPFPLLSLDNTPLSHKFQSPLIACSIHP